jgi:hypothetical protein
MIPHLFVERSFRQSLGILGALAGSTKPIYNFPHYVAAIREAKADAPKLKDSP